MLDMLDTEAAVNTLSPKTYADMVGIFSRKAYENGELEIDEYLRIVKPLFGETGEMVTKKIENYRTNMLEGGDTEYNAMVTEAYIKAGDTQFTFKGQPQDNVYTGRDVNMMAAQGGDVYTGSKLMDAGDTQFTFKGQPQADTYTGRDISMMAAQGGKAYTGSALSDAGNSDFTFTAI